VVAFKFLAGNSIYMASIYRAGLVFRQNSAGASAMTSYKAKRRIGGSIPNGCASKEPTHFRLAIPYPRQTAFVACRDNTTQSHVDIWQTMENSLWQTVTQNHRPTGQKPSPATADASGHNSPFRPYAKRFPITCQTICRSRLTTIAISTPVLSIAPLLRSYFLRWPIFRVMEG